MTASVGFDLDLGDVMEVKAVERSGTYFLFLGAKGGSSEVHIASCDPAKILAVIDQMRRVVCRAVGLPTAPADMAAIASEAERAADEYAAAGELPLIAGLATHNGAAGCVCDLEDD